MQINASAARPATTVLASQSIDMRTHTTPPGGVTMWVTERDYRLAGATNGIDTFTSLQDAIDAARQLSAGDMPGLAVMNWRGGFRVHDVHAVSRTYWSNSPHGDMPPMTKLVRRSSVPFAAGNLRDSKPGSSSSPALVRSERLAALVDGDRVFVPTDRSWAGRPTLGELPPQR